VPFFATMAKRLAVYLMVDSQLFYYDYILKSLKITRPTEGDIFPLGCHGPVKERKYQIQY